MAFNFLEGIPDIGHEVAEEDVSLLMDVFIPTKAYEQAKKKGKAFVVGRKGSGKTAIKLKFSSEKTNYIRVYSIAPEDIDIVGFSEILSRYEGDFAGGSREKLLVKVWKLFFLVNVMVDVIDNGMAGIRYSNEILDIKNYLSSQGWSGSGGSRKITHVLQHVLKTLEILRGESKSTPVSDLIDSIVDGDPGVKLAVKGLSKIIASFSKPYLVCLDRVDDEFFEEAQSADSDSGMLYVKSLVSSIYSLITSGFGEKLLIKAFLPSDIYNELHFRHRDKYNAYKEVVNWSSVSLFEMIVGRLEKNLSQRVLRKFASVDPRKRRQMIWEEFFPRIIRMPTSRGGVVDIGTWNFLVNRTLYRPRDILSLCKRVFERVEADGEREVTKDAILAAVERYSNDLFAQVVDEYYGICEEIEGAMNVFSNGTRKYKYEDFYSQVFQPAIGASPQGVKDLICHMFSAGFIGVVREDDAGVNPLSPMKTEVYCYENDHIDPNRSGGVLVINPAFSYALGLVDRNVAF